jgi:mono/diheme cytochrome c family protein
VTRGVLRTALLGASLLTASAQAEPPPAQDYVLECRGCHGARGEGVPGNVPALAQTARFLATPRGRAYLVRVPGVAGSQISDARIAALLNWMLREFARDPTAPPDFTPYTASEVASERARPLLDPHAERTSVLGPINPNN